MKPAVHVRGAVLSAETPALVVPLVADSAERLVSSAQKALAAGADLVEWRADYWLAAAGPQATGHEVCDLLRMLRHSLGEAPLLFTVRTQAEGGLAVVDDSYAELLAHVIRSGEADMVDVEFRRRDAQELIRLARAQDVATIASFHDFSATPRVDEMVSLLAGQEAMGASVAKLAVMPHNPEDVAALLTATAQRSRTAGIPLMTMSMAGMGAISRIAGHVFGSAATFGSLGQQASAPGQIPVESLRSLRDLMSQINAESTSSADSL